MSSCLSLLYSGLSPPTRGNRAPPAQRVWLSRSIPAHAGEPPRRALAVGRRPVYPRPRGGTTASAAASMSASGLSPPTRGNHNAASYIERPRGSIPAHAGEPATRCHKSFRARVYPRPRGGTFGVIVRMPGRKGLSPPTRGNRRRSSPYDMVMRSIPAHAGEPLASGGTPISRAVYPRPRGGTPPSPRAGREAEGLSPPTRGNPDGDPRPSKPFRSIPAHAGEPTRRKPCAREPRVYPRPRGGTRRPFGDVRPRVGLSPPTRGNRIRELVPNRERRSIPAHAGEPRGRAARAHGREVYPRPRGGTLILEESQIGCVGLSPPTRGNRRSSRDCAACARSIPAHAGEPGSTTFGISAATVYPRPRGGTTWSPSSPRGVRGLSPPTRGNPAGQ